MIIPIPPAVILTMTHPCVGSPSVQGQVVCLVVLLVGLAFIAYVFK